MPLLGRNRTEALAGSEIADDVLALVVVADQRPRSRAVVVALGLPARDESVEHDVADREEELDVLIDRVVVAARDVGGKAQPVARLTGRAWSVAHELDDRLLI